MAALSETTDMTPGNDNGQDLLEQAHLAFLRGQLPQAQQMLHTLLAAQPDNEAARELLAQVQARQYTPGEASVSPVRPAGPTAKNPLHTIAVLYANWLTGDNGESGRVPYIFLILVLCPMAMLAAAVFGAAPALNALHHGVPLNGYIQERTRHGGMETESVHSLVIYSAVTFSICVPLLLSALFYLLGWFGRSEEEDVT